MELELELEPDPSLARVYTCSSGWSGSRIGEREGARGNERRGSSLRPEPAHLLRRLPQLPGGSVVEGLAQVGEQAAPPAPVGVLPRPRHLPTPVTKADKVHPARGSQVQHSPERPAAGLFFP